MVHFWKPVCIACIVSVKTGNIYPQITQISADFFEYEKLLLFRNRSPENLKVCIISGL